MPSKALLTGINDYQKIADLHGCLNDVENIQDLLAKHFGFTEFKVLEDQEVTWDAIIAGFDWLAEDLEEGDRVVFHFSGHGSYMPSQDEDEADDEIICLWDMDWNDPNSFMRDDDLRDLTQFVPEGVRLTVILDCCHSGTGTRAFSANLAPQAQATPTSRMIIQQDSERIAGTRSGLAAAIDWNSSGIKKLLEGNRQQVAQARFVAPPAELQIASLAPRKKNRIGAFMRSLKKRQEEADMNHQLLAGAMDSQTAADAFINGSPNGAFSYYLCSNSRSQPSGSYDSVMNATIHEVAQEGFSQVPQNEGPFGHERLFGGAASAGSHTSPETNATLPVISSTTAIADTLPGEAAAGLTANAGYKAPHANQRFANNLLRVHEKFLDLTTLALSQGPSPVRAPASSAPRQTDEVLVYVHGISQHRQGYSDAWFAALQPHLERALPKQEVLWSQLVNPRQFSRAATDQIEDLRERIQSELQAKHQHATQQQAGTRGLFDGRGFSIDDFARYMLFEETRNAILSTFDQVVRPLLKQGKRVQIISHSWGTVVAYEGLRLLDQEDLAGRVENLFTLGSALSISAVRSNLFGRLDNGRLPKHVRRIINVDAGGDIVGGNITNDFVVFREFLGVEPTGCSTIPWTNIALSPSCAHSSYFKPENEEVNRDIIARFL